MSTSRTARRLSAALLALAAAVLLLPAGPAVAQEDPAAVMPADAILYLAVADVKALPEKFKRTSLFAFYKDPAMLAVVGPAEKKITELIDEKLAEAWKELDLEQRPEKPPWPQGRAAMALKLKSVTRSWTWQQPDGPPQVHEYKTEEPQFVFLLDMGENAELAGKLIKKGVDKAVEEGHMRRSRESVRGIEMEILTEAPPRPGDDAPRSTSSSPNEVCYAFKDATLVIGNSVQLVKDVLARMGGADLPSLANDPGLRSVRAAVGGDGDLLIHFNPQALIEFLKTHADADEKEELIKTVQVMGFDNIIGIGASLQIAPNEQIDYRARAQVAVRGQPRGLAALLIPSAGPTRPAGLLTKGLAGFFAANYDPAKVFEQAIRLAQESTGEDIEKGIQESMDQTGGEGAGGRPPVNLKTEVIGQLTAPIMWLFQITPPYAAPDSMQWLLAGRVRDGRVLDTALARIHETFIAGGDKEMRREFDGTNIYLLPGADPMAMLMRGAMGARMGGREESQSGLAVAGEHAVLGSLKWVEQTVRDLRRERPETLADDPMYRHAAQFLPAQAGGVIYFNHQVLTGVLWEQITAAAKAPRAQPDANARPRFDEDGFPVMGESRPPGPRDTPVGELVGQLEEFIDFTRLPEFSAVRKHFGADIGYVSGNEQGLFLEVLTVKAPPGQ